MPYLRGLIEVVKVQECVENNYNYNYNIIISGQILLAELAEKLWRDLAAVPASCICTEPASPEPCSTQLAVRLIQCVCDKQ
jgi:hypothetical protein